MLIGTKTEISISLYSMEIMVPTVLTSINILLDLGTVIC